MVPDTSTTLDWHATFNLVMGLLAPFLVTALALSPEWRQARGRCFMLLHHASVTIK